MERPGPGKGPVREQPVQRLSQPATGRARQAPAPHRRSLRPRHLRGHRGPVPQEAHACGVRPGQPRPAAARVRAHRLRPARLGGAGLQPGRLRGGPAARPDALPGVGLAAAVRGHPVRARGLLRRRRVRRARQDHPGARREPRHGRQPRLLHVDPAEVLPRRHQAAGPVRAGGAGRRAVAAGRHREAVRSRPRSRRASSTRWWSPSSRRTRCSGSTTTSARRRSRTSWRSGSRTRCSNPSGTRTTSTTCRSRWPRTSASAAGPATTTASARPATSSRTTSCSCSP